MYVAQVYLIYPLGRINKIWSIYIFLVEISDLPLCVRLTGLKELYLHHNEHIGHISPCKVDRVKRIILNVKQYQTSLRLQGFNQLEMANISQQYF